MSPDLERESHFSHMGYTRVLKKKRFNRELIIKLKLKVTIKYFIALGVFGGVD